MTVPVTIRPARPADDGAVERVAGRDTRPVPAPPWLVGELDGEVVAVLSLGGGDLVADPFRRTAEVVRLLRLHASASAAARCASRRRGLGRGIPLRLAGGRA